MFLIDGLRDRVRDSSAPCGVNEVKLRRGQIVREGLHTTLTDLRLRKNHKSARARWQQEICSGPALFVVGRDKGKLSHFWRHAYQMARSGRYLGSVVNPDTGVRVESEEDLRVANHRADVVRQRLSGDDATGAIVPARTLRRWIARCRAAETRFGAGYIGLLRGLANVGIQRDAYRKYPCG